MIGATPEEFDRAMLPLTNEIYDRYIAPELEAHGLDPAQYHLAFERSEPEPQPIPGFGGVADGCWTVAAEYRVSLDPAVEATRVEAVRRLAVGLGLDVEIIDEATRWQNSQRAYAGCYPSWRYVSGGRALHAFFGDDPLPICGVDPRHAPGGRPAVWHGAATRYSTGYLHRARHHHKRCWKLQNLETQRRIGELIARQRAEMGGNPDV